MLGSRRGGPGLGGCLLGQSPASGFSQLAWLCGGRRDAARLGVSACGGPAFPAHQSLGRWLGNLRVEIKISVWDVCPSRRHRLCL